MSSNPFDKTIDTKDTFKSEDYGNVFSRLDYLKEARGVGLITANPGMGKTFSIRAYSDTLNNSLFKVVYIKLTTITVMEFYRLFALELGLIPLKRKVDLFRQVQEEIVSLVNKKIIPFIIIDEAQYLRTDIINDLKMLLNFEMDSKNNMILLLVGQPTLINLLNRSIHEATRGRIIMSYTIIGLGAEEMKRYIEERLSLVGASPHLFTPSAVNALHQSSNGSIRTLNNLIVKALIIGCNKNLTSLDENIILDAYNEISL